MRNERGDEEQSREDSSASERSIRKFSRKGGKRSFRASGGGCAVVRASERYTYEGARIRRVTHRESRRLYTTACSNCAQYYRLDSQRVRTEARRTCTRVRRLLKFCSHSHIAHGKIRRRGKASETKRSRARPAAAIFEKAFDSDSKSITKRAITGLRILKTK